MARLTSIFINLLKVVISCLLIFNTSCAPIKLADFLSPYDNYQLSSEISYGLKKRQKLDIYKPMGRAIKEAIVIFIYGGGWRSGSRSDYRFIAQPFASKGYITIIPDYQLYPEVQFPVFVQDIAKAILWVHQEYKKENKEPKIILVGHSAGAHIAALLALDERYFKEEAAPEKVLHGWVALAGPHAFNPLGTKRTKPIFETFKNKIEQVKPVTFARADAPPGLLIHGGKDTTVYEKNSVLLKNAIKNKQGQITFRSLPGVGHIGILLSLAEDRLFTSDTKREIFKFIESLN
jgi:acetyl esterase/lipase